MSDDYWRMTSDFRFIERDGKQVRQVRWVKEPSDPREEMWADEDLKAEGGK